ncbi:MAG: nucleoside hydrolase [Actinomycetota bacterium]
MSDLVGEPSDDRRSVVIDCDPGQDDAIALLLAFGTPTIASSIEFITTVAGNSAAHVTHRNGRRVVDLATQRRDEHIAVHRGAERSLAFHSRTYFVGDDELPGWETPSPSVGAISERGAGVERRSAVEALVELGRRRPAGSVTIYATGPLTNVALALLADTSFEDALGAVVWMGSSIGRGNITPAAEFNASIDPDALAVVLAAGVDLTVVPAEIGESATIDEATLAEIDAVGTPSAAAVARLVRAMGDDIDRERYARLGRPMYDPTVIAYAARAEMFEAVPTSLVVDTDSGPSYGSTHFDLDGRTGGEPNCTLVCSVDASAFRRHLIDTLSSGG